VSERSYGALAGLFGAASRGQHDVVSVVSRHRLPPGLVVLRDFADHAVEIREDLVVHLGYAGLSTVLGPIVPRSTTTSAPPPASPNPESTD
jgi:hypothetical protein